jgi:uncharacterized protein (DUF58 family)
VSKGALLEPGFLKRLDRMALVARRAVVGKSSAERRSKKRGTSVEFADFRNYVAGDDFRHIDWNLYGRLGQLFLRLFVAEEDLDVRIYVDRTKSMDFGTPSKLEYARKIGAALAYLGLRRQDRVSMQSFGEEGDAPLPAARGHARIFRVFDYLESLEPAGVTDFRTTFRKGLPKGRRGAAIVISDFLTPEGYADGLRALAGGTMQVALVQVAAPEEISPARLGDLELIDVETGTKVPVTVTPRLIQSYQRTYQAFCEELKTFARRYQMSYVHAPTDVLFEKLIFDVLQQGGIVGGR